MPDSYKKLAEYSDCLPGDKFPASYPFGSTNLNIG